MSDYSRYVVGAAAHSCPLAVGQISWQHFEEGGGGVNERLHRSFSAEGKGVNSCLQVRWQGVSCLRHRRCKGPLSPTIFCRSFGAKAHLQPQRSLAQSKKLAAAMPPKGCKLPYERAKGSLVSRVWLRHIRGPEGKIRFISAIWICMRSYIFIFKTVK